MFLPLMNRIPCLGERYGHSMINDFNRWAVGWVDWNIVMNRTDEAFRFSLDTPDRTAISAAPAHSIVTYLFAN